MSVETTICIRDDILSRLDDLSGMTGKTRTEIIQSLFLKIMKDMGPWGVQGTVKYQHRRKDTAWKRVHVRIEDDIYEYMLDLRKFMKMSVSFILAFAVRKYHDELVLKEYTDNNLISGYTLRHEMINGIKTFRIYWGKGPENHGPE